MVTRLGTRLGTNLGTELGEFADVPPPAPPPDYDALVAGLAPFSWTRADTYTGAGAKVAAFDDRYRAAHALSQGTASAQVALPTADAAFNNQVVATFVSGSITGYVSTLAASLWKFLHDGSGMEVFIVAAPVSLNPTFAYLISTYTSGANASTDILESANVPTSPRWRITDNAGAFVFDVTTAPAGSWSGTPTYYDAAYSESAAPSKYVLRIKAATAVSGNPGVAPGTNNPPAALTLGRRANGSSACSMRWADLLVFDRVLTDAERTTVRQYIANRYGIA